MKYEDAAYPVEKATTQWICRSCNRNHFGQENTARRCCATDVPCSKQGCGNRIEIKPQRGYITTSRCCKECEERVRQQRADKQRITWEAREKKPWDGKAMLYSDSRDRFFNDLCELYDYYADEKSDYMIDTVDDLEIRICVPSSPPYFELAEYLCDCLPEEDYGKHLPGNAEEVENIVNEYLSSHTFSWEPGPYALQITDEDIQSETYPPNPNTKYISPFDNKAK